MHQDYKQITITIVDENILEVALIEPGARISGMFTNHMHTVDFSPDSENPVLL